MATTDAIGDILEGAIGGASSTVIQNNPTVKAEIKKEVINQYWWVGALAIYGGFKIILKLLGRD